MKNTVMADFAHLDAHTHILPGMDDGSESADESIRMIRMLIDQGVSDICLTPHFYPRNEEPAGFLKRRERSIRALLAKTAELDFCPKMHFGAEVEFFQGISRAEEMKQMCIGQSGILLIEMPFTRWTQRMTDELYVLKDHRGITPLIAHVDRYLHFGNEEIAEDMAQSGILIQANQSFFMRGFASARAMRMMKRGMIHFIGSDCHNIKSRKPELDKAIACIRKKCGVEAIEYLCNMNRRIRLRGDAGC